MRAVRRLRLRVEVEVGVGVEVKVGVEVGVGVGPGSGVDAPPFAQRSDRYEAAERARAPNVVDCRRLRLILRGVRSTKGADRFRRRQRPHCCVPWICGTT